MLTCDSFRGDIEILEIASDHHSHHSLSLNLVSGKLAGVATIAQNYCAIGEFLNLLKPV